MAEILLMHHDGDVRTRTGAAVARWTTRNPLLDGESLGIDAFLDSRGMNVVPSGRMDEAHRTWGPQGAAAFHAWCERLRSWKVMDQAGPGRRVLIRPHAADVLSDVQRCVSFARSERGGLEVAMDPVGLLAPSMIDRASDHLLRFGEAIEHLPAMGAVVLTNVVLDERGECVPTPIHRGLVDVGSLRLFVVLASERSVPLLLLASEWQAQAAVLET